jgi:hypothetical protein
MTGRLAITETDLRALLAVTEYEDDSLVTLMPVATLASLRDLVGADEVSFYRVDPWRSRQQVNLSSAAAEEDGSFCGEDSGGWSERHWELFWVFEATAHPWQGREFGPVTKLSDFNSRKEIDRHHLGDVLRAAGVRWVLSVPLARSGPWCDGLVVYRCSGLDFTDRERLLFTLLRPHLQLRVRAQPVTDHTAASAAGPGGRGPDERADGPTAGGVSRHGTQAPGEHLRSARSPISHGRGRGRVRS